MEFDAEQPDLDLREARTAALNYLARREHSCKELREKLSRRGIDDRAVRAVVEQLTRENLVSDERYAEAFTRSRVNRLYGPLRIRAELRQRGVSDSLIEQALSAFSEQWQDLAGEWAARKAGAKLDRNEQARVYRSGTNRGFTHEQMMRAIDRLK